MPNQQDRLDLAFRALGDPTRRAVIARLSRGPAAVTELAAPFDMALPSFTQHLRVLEDAGLVRSDKVGRVRTFRVQPRVLLEAQEWMGKQRALWEARMDQFDAFVTKPLEKTSGDKEKKG